MANGNTESVFIMFFPFLFSYSFFSGWLVDGDCFLIFCFGCRRLFNSARFQLISFVCETLLLSIMKLPFPFHSQFSTPVVCLSPVKTKKERRITKNENEWKNFLYGASKQVGIKKKEESSRKKLIAFPMRF